MANPTTGSGHVGAGHAPAPAALGAGGAADRRVHPSLIRPMLYGGVERPVLVLEATTALGLLFSLGPHLATFGIVAVIVGVLHPAMVWVSARDPLATAVYIRSLGWRAYYPPHASMRVSRGTPPHVRPTLPAPV